MKDNKYVEYASSVINKIAGSNYNLRNMPIFADSAHKSCGLRLILRNLLTVPESKVTSYIRSSRNPQRVECADKFYFTCVFTRNPRKFSIIFRVFFV